jgi:division protein CdvB (Snf7/Vps24/ESCRT-III family)
MVRLTKQGVFIMPSSFFAMWSGQHKKKVASEGTKNKILDAIKPSEPLKPCLEETQRKLGMQVSRMESTLNNLKLKDRKIFNDVGEALQNHDTRRAKSLSNELSQVRKIAKVVDSTRMSTAHVRLRLETLTELGDVMSTLNPATLAIRELKGGLSSIVPESDQSLAEISSTLGEVLNNTLNPTKDFTDVMGFGSEDSEETLKIIEEASAIAEVDTVNKIPDLTSVLPSSATKSYSNRNSNNDSAFSSF